VEGDVDAKRLALGTFGGALTLSAVGYLIFGVVWPGFFTDFMQAGTATGVARQPPLLWAVAAAMLSYSLLLTLAIASRGAAPTVRAGMGIGAVVSFLLWFTADFMLYGISNVGHLKGIVVDPLLEVGPGAIAGGLIAVVIRKAPTTSVERDSARAGNRPAA
jgi:hypothetical protein